MTALISFRRLMPIMAAALVAACAVGPDYHAPVAPAVGIYNERPQPERPEAAPVSTAIRPSLRRRLRFARPRKT